MGPSGDAQARSWAGASGPFQLMPGTWDRMNGLHAWPEGRRSRPRLIGRVPSSTTLAQQMRVAETLRVRVVGGGMGHWDCHRWGLGVYGDPDGPRELWIHNEPRMPKRPHRCARNLQNKWGRSKTVAESICGVTS